MRFSSRHLPWLISLVAACGGNTPLLTSDVPVDRMDVGDSAAPDASPDATDAEASLCQGGAPRAPMGPCGCNDDCADPGALCGTEADTGAPGGVCLVRCDPAMAARDGFVCRMVPQGFHVLTPRCSTTTPCERGRACRYFTGTPLICYPYCSSDEDCGSGHCNRYTGACTATATMPSGAATGEACTADADCRSEDCLPFPGGYCSPSCAVNGAECPDNGVCYVPQMASAGATYGMCLQRCLRHADCTRTGYQCSRVMGSVGGCVPL